MKCSVWENITVSYNALQTSGQRTSSQLKAIFDVMKRKTKKVKSFEKVNYSEIHIIMNYLCLNYFLSRYIICNT